MRIVTEVVNRRPVPRKRAENTMKKIVSLRVSDEEMRQLVLLSKRSRRNLSDVLRDALNTFLQMQHDQRCLNG